MSACLLLASILASSCGGQSDDEPLASPTGEIIVSDAELRHHAIDVETQRLRQLAPNETSSALARWSPGSRYVAFAHSAGPTVGIQIRVARDSGTDVTEADVVTTFVGPSDEAVPTWAPDCSRIAYGAFLLNGGIEVWTANVDGGGRSQIPTDGETLTGFDWSPSGEQLLAHRLGESLNEANATIVTIDIATGRQTEVTNPPEGSADTWARWSPDGQFIAFERTSADEFSQVMVADANGDNERSLTTGDSEASTPVWSPDGEWIAYSFGEDDDVAISRMDGSDQGLLDISGSPTDWGPRPGSCPRSFAGADPLP